MNASQTPVVLVAEDGEFYRTLVSSQLTQLGWAHDIADNGAEALRLWRQAPQRYALLLTDIEMPWVDGFELARRIRSGCSAGARLPIVAHSSRPNEYSALCWRRAGIDECLPKPTEPRALRDLLQRWQPRTLPQAARPALKLRLALA